MELTYRAVVNQLGSKVTKLPSSGVVAGCSKVMKRSGAAVLAYTNRAAGDGSKSYAPYKGQLKLAVYVNSGLLTVHVVAARHLRSSLSKKLCNSYVKLSLFPDESKRTKCKTEIGINTNLPTYDEKFSFELLPSDSRRRLVISVWNKHTTDRHCELLGCMSFGVRHILQQKKNAINGWYFLLHENVGRRKHLHVQEHRLEETSLYMDMHGIDLPGVSNTSEDSGLDNGEPAAAKPPPSSSPVKKVHLGTGAVAVAVEDVGCRALAEPFRVSSSSVAIVHQSTEELEALKETIEEQKVAIGMLQEKLLQGNGLDLTKARPPLPDKKQHHSPLYSRPNSSLRQSPAPLNARSMTPLPIVSSHSSSSNGSTGQQQQHPNGLSGCRLVPPQDEDSERCPLHNPHEPTCPMSYRGVNGAFKDIDDDDDDVDDDVDDSLSSSTESDSETEVYCGPPSPTKSPTRDLRAENRCIIEVHLRRGEGGFGITLTGDRPARVLTVLPGSPAHRFGVLPQDVILRIDDHDVANLSSDTVARAIRHCESYIKLQLQRLRLPTTDPARLSEPAAGGSIAPPKSSLVSKPCPPERHASKSSAILRDIGGKHTENGALYPSWPQPQHGSLESRSRTSEGDSLGTSEISGEADADNSYIDMRGHWAMMKTPV